MNTVVKPLYINLMIIDIVEFLNSMLVKSLAKAFLSHFFYTWLLPLLRLQQLDFSLFFLFFIVFFFLKFKLGLLFGTIRLNYVAPIFNQPTTILINQTQNRFSLVYCPVRGLIFNIKIKINLFMRLAIPPKKFPSKFHSLVYII